VGQRGEGAVKELMRANDIVLLSFVCSLLEGEGIGHIVLDGNMSILEGSLGAIPRRVMVEEAAFYRACRILRENGLGHELRTP
jgi:hypothetical protein